MKFLFQIKALGNIWLGALVVLIPFFDRPAYGAFLFPDRGLVWHEALQSDLGRQDSFVIPNEEYPADMIPIVKHAPVGIYFSVGTERGFIGAALSPKVSHLVLVDRDAHVVKYNLINITLLKLSDSREEYLRLRKAQSIDVWRHAASVKGDRLNIIEKNLLKNESTYRWFREKQTPKFEAAPATEDLIRTTERVTGHPMHYCFQNANYLYDDTMFERLHEMAAKDRIEVVRTNLAVASVETPGATSRIRLMEAITKSKVPIAVIDISNAWGMLYMKEQELQGFMRVLDPFLHDDSILVGTENLHINRYDVRSKTTIVDSTTYQETYAVVDSWAYAGFRVRTLKNLGWGTNPQFSFQALFSASTRKALDRAYPFEANNRAKLTGYGVLSDLPVRKYTGIPIAAFDECESILTESGIQKND